MLSIVGTASGFPFFIVQYLNPFHEEILGKRWKRDGMQNRTRVVQRDSISSGKERQEYLAHYFHGLGQNESVREWKVIFKDRRRLRYYSLSEKWHSTLSVPLWGGLGRLEPWMSKLISHFVTLYVIDVDTMHTYRCLKHTST